MRSEVQRHRAVRTHVGDEVAVANRAKRCEEQTRHHQRQNVLDPQRSLLRNDSRVKLRWAGCARSAATGAAATHHHALPRVERVLLAVLLDDVANGPTELPARYVSGEGVPHARPRSAYWRA